VVREEGVQASERRACRRGPWSQSRRGPGGEHGGWLIEVATTERVAPTMSERMHMVVAWELRVLEGKRKDTNEWASIYRLKRISNGS
jgi:hypothetical protein